jgi:hypothetical protein
MHKPFVVTIVTFLLFVCAAFSQPAVVPGTNGRVWFRTTYSDSNYATLRNGHMDGAYSTVPAQGEKIEGEVTYKKSAVNYIPVKRVIYSVRGRKPDTAFYELNSFQTIFARGDSVAGKAPGDTIRRVLSATDDSVAEEAPTYPFIGIGFGDDPAVIPRGAWHVICTKTGTDAAIVDYDDNGNAIRVRTFSEDGTLLKDEHFPPCGKRKMIQRDALGATQVCPLEMPKN